ncbi:MAG: PAS domain-containing sensor histidine kinase [Pirellulales bacterium]
MDFETTEQPPVLDRNADLGTILQAWNSATLRLQQTHESLRSEVARLSDELEIKNRELARKNRLADLGQMSSHIAHEVRNNLVPVKLYLSLLRRRLAGDGEGLSVLDRVMTGVTALDATVEDLLHFAADRDPHGEVLPLRPLIEEVRGSLAPQLAAQGVEISIDVPADATLWVDGNMLRRAILNIVLNGLDVMPRGGQMGIAVSREDDGLALRIHDTGPGLSLDVCQRVFEPFFTTKSHGTGLGLAIVYHIAQVHGGWVQAENGPHGGAVFTIHLPYHPSEALSA